ncbi:MAG: dTMP kinase [Gammaproteobacteria bacterium]
MTQGKFITLEGIEGAGKSTVATALAEALCARGVVVRQTREPGGTPLAERLRRLVLERGSEVVSPEAETLIMFAARAVHLDNLVRPALAQGEWVICDRFTDATRAYQGGGRGVDLALIEQLARSVHRGLEPDLTLLLDLPVSVGLERARARRQANGETVTDRFESETLQFFERVRACYLDLARQAPDRCRIIDASADAQSVSKAALAALLSP